MFVSILRIFSSTAEHGPKMKLIMDESGHLIPAVKVMENPAGLIENKGVTGGYTIGHQELAAG